jgi:serine phosphatase RsbU (regulator of sigma subunit)
VNARALARLLPSLQSLAAQIAIALYQAKVYAQTLAHQKVQHELDLARRIQVSFLPREIPQIAGWQLAASLEPAREMAGDFYDLIPLPGGGLGVLIADVADKGVGPALYMALSRTLIRTFAVQFESQPELVIQTANLRILQDAANPLFVTVFYGVLDPKTGRLTYVNAGHNPPWILNPAGGELRQLTRTGRPLGIEEDFCWQQRSTQLEPGDRLVLYTDGAADALDEHEQPFGEERLLDAVQSHLTLPAPALLPAIMDCIYHFTGATPQFDDITLVVVARDEL